MSRQFPEPEPQREPQAGSAAPIEGCKVADAVAAALFHATHGSESASLSAVRRFLDAARKRKEKSAWFVAASDCWRKSRRFQPAAFDDMLTAADSVARTLRIHLPVAGRPSAFRGPANATSNFAYGSAAAAIRKLAAQMQDSFGSRGDPTMRNVYQAALSPAENIAVQTLWRAVDRLVAWLDDQDDDGATMPELPIELAETWEATLVVAHESSPDQVPAPPAAAAIAAPGRVRDWNKEAQAYLTQHPEAGVREVAKHLGCSKATVGKLPAWKETIAQRRKKPARLKAQALPREVAEDALQRLIEQHERDYEPSPLDPSGRNPHVRKMP